MADKSIVGSRADELKRSVWAPPAANPLDKSAVGSGGGTVAAVVSELLTPKECAAFRRCSLRTLDRERAEARGPPYVQIGSRIFYLRQDLNRFIATHVREPRVADIVNEPTPRLRSRLPKIAGGVGDEFETSRRRRTLPDQSDEIGQLEEAEEPEAVLARPRAKSSAKRVQR